ncbi:MAG: LysM peptidoglycan-binding domain-containing protein [Gammaproteobacteria bacterium]|nr:LysM peptidoglycan-binding domain-containing protein [Gammaproteobacteria bacterium]
MQNGFSLPSPTQDLYFHHVSPGDTLSGIINTYYPGNINRMDAQIKQVMIDNPGIKNANLIKPGQLIVLRTASTTMCLGPIEPNEVNKIKHLWSIMTPEKQKAIKQTAPVYNGLTLGLAGGGTALFTLEKTLKSNMSFLNGIPDAYKDYKGGKITKYEFDKLRKLKLSQYTNNIGPIIDKTIYGEGKLQNAFKLKPGRSLNPTKTMTQHLSKLSKISTAASNSSVILVGVGLTASCYQISQAEAVTEKNEIAVKALTSTAAGAAFGAVATIFLVGTPVGWGIILVVGAASAATAWSAGELAGSIYKSQFSDTDVVNSLGINKYCN